MRQRPGAIRRGIAAVEFAFLLPFFLILLMGLWEVGRYISMQNLLDNAAREGGRLGASSAYFSSNNFNSATPPNAAFTLPPPSANTAFELEQRVLLYMQNSGLTITGATVTISNAGSSTNAKSWSYTYTQGGTNTGSGYDPTAQASQLDLMTITVTLPYKNGAWSPLSWFISQSATMTATASWVSMADIPLTVSTTIPSKPLGATDPLP
jgi:Flp pilus assembly protein TadG